MSERFRASVQYGDWEGTAAADNADKGDVTALLRDLEMITAEELVVAVKIYVGETHHGEVPEALVQAYVAKAGSHETIKDQLMADSGPFKVREVSFEMPIEEIVGKFKRFSIAISRRGLDFTNREYEVDE